MRHPFKCIDLNDATLAQVYRDLESLESSYNVPLQNIPQQCSGELLNRIMHLQTIAIKIINVLKPWLLEQIQTLHVVVDHVWQQVFSSATTVTRFLIKVVISGCSSEVPQIVGELQRLTQLECLPWGE